MMAKKSARRRGRARASTARSRRSRRVAKRVATKSRARRRISRAPKRRTQKRRRVVNKARPARSARRREAATSIVAGKKPRLDRVRRILDEVIPMPPSSLNLDRRGSAARTGRAELQDSIIEHAGMTPALTGGDVDANWENAYFSGDEAPGGDNPTPDQEVVEDIGRSLGVEYQDNEELRGSEKVVERDKHRWELDPASSEDYKDRK